MTSRTCLDCGRPSVSCRCSPGEGMAGDGWLADVWEAAATGADIEGEDLDCIRLLPECAVEEWS